MASRLIFVVLLMVPCIRTDAQVIVWAGGDPGQMALTHLQGPNVTITNAFSQIIDPSHAGIFRDNTASIGLDTGMVICTGHAQVVVGPNNMPNSTFGGGFTATDTDIATMTPLYPGTIADPGIIQLDLVPWGDTLKIRYVFASEEYDEYGCSDKDDRLGMFLSGPGVTGPFSNGAANIARLPISDLPVSVNSLNRGVPGSNGSLALCNMNPGWEQDTIYYINNDLGEGTQMDGYTVVLTATAVVVPGAGYHLKIAIADINDANFDSAVFLPEGAISCTDLSTGIGHLATSKPQALFPNPSTGIFNVRYGGGAPSRIIVTDIAGQVVLEVNDPRTNAGSTPVDLGDRARGVYQVSVDGPRGRTTERLILQ